MESGIKILRFRGIDVFIHVTFPLILIWAGVSYGLLRGLGLEGALFGILITSLLFGIVLLHEFGHSLVAQRFGVKVKRIVLFPLGGIAQMDHIPENPWQEFAIAIAGPAVNFALAIAMALLFPAELLRAGQGGWVGLIARMGSLNLQSLLGYLFVSNLFLALFNLIPAFPLDGGRVLRALLATRLDYVNATRIAVWIGQVISLALGLWGFSIGNLFIIVIAVFIYMGAGQEGQMVAVRSVLRQLTVAEAYSPDAAVLRPDQTIGEAVQMVLHSSQNNFAVCDGSVVRGMLTYSRLVQGLEEYGRNSAVATVMEHAVGNVGLEDTLYQAEQTMTRHRRDALVVEESGDYRGLITRNDIGEAMRLLGKRTTRR